jgi:predicted RNase H-like HicB family nuclease
MEGVNTVLDQYIFPAIFEENDGDGYTVTFPDCPGCITEGDTEQDAFANATEALELHLWGMERDRDDIPVPSPIRTVTTHTGQVVVLIRANMRLMRRNMRERAVRKMVTLPRWLNDAAEDAGVNYSQVLQDGLKDLLRLYTPDTEEKRRAG